MKYSREFKLRCINLGECTIGDAAKKRNIPKQTISRWIRIYNRYGDKGLENKKSGPKEKPINPIIEEKVLNLWKKKKRSAYRMLKDLSKRSYFSNGINPKEKTEISKREIYKIYEKHKLRFNRKKKKKRKFFFLKVHFW